MARFVTVGYGDQAGYERTEPAAREAAHASDARLLARGTVMGVAGAPVQVRNPDGTGVTKTDGPYLRSELPVAGFAIIEARDMEEAIALASAAPCAVAHGVVEVWPLEEVSVIAPSVCGAA